jgi:carbon storage regulator
MLVISRRKGQRITIGDDIEIVVTAVHKNGVKLGIAAPRGFTVLRAEVRDAILSANVEATKSSVAQAEAIAGVAPERTVKALPTVKLAIGRQHTDTSASQSGDAPKATAVKESTRPRSHSTRPADVQHSEPGKPEGP